MLEYKRSRGQTSISCCYPLATDLLFTNKKVVTPPLHTKKTAVIQTERYRIGILSP